MKNFYDLFIHELKDIYDAEIQLVKTLPEFARAAQCKDLKEAFREHLKETECQVERLQAIGEEHNINLAGPQCEIMKNFIREGQKIIQSNYPYEVKDAALISCAQRIEHYEIAVYGSLKEFAKHLELKEAKKLLEESFKEEVNADKTLSKIALGGFLTAGVNEMAVCQCS